MKLGLETKYFNAVSFIVTDGRYTNGLPVSVLTQMLLDTRTSYSQDKELLAHPVSEAAKQKLGVILEIFRGYRISPSTEVLECLG
jgi:hypothetical protein